MNDPFDSIQFNILTRHSVSRDSNFEILEVNARDLIVPERFDFAAKLLYIDHKVKGMNMEYALEIYKAHIYAITDFKYSEAGQPEKNTFDKFISIFNQLIENFIAGTFDFNANIIPIDKNNVALDGAHRICCAAYFNRKVSAIRFTDLIANVNPDYNFFQKQFLLPTYSDAMALEFCKWNTDLYIACIWPKAAVNLRELADIEIRKSNKVIYKREFKLTYQALRNFMIQVYSNFEWLGDRFEGIYSKLDLCYDKHEEVIVYLFEATDLDAVLSLKKKIRDIFKIENHSIHMTDNLKETRQLADLLFNVNSIHHLTFGTPDRFVDSITLINEFKDIINRLGLNISDFIVDSSQVMAVYGIREAEDLDFLSVCANSELITQYTSKPNSIDSHDQFLEYYDISKYEMIHNPFNYFVFNEVKFIKLDLLKAMKEKRNEDKDKNDLKLIQAYIKNDRFDLAFLSFKNSWRRKKRIIKKDFRLKSISILQLLGIYKQIRTIYRFLKKKR